MVGELSAEAGELGVPPGGARSSSVTVVTSWLVPLGVGVGSGTSACCSCSSGFGTCGRPVGDPQDVAKALQAGRHPGQGMQSREAGHGFLQAHLHKHGHWHTMGRL